MSPSTPLRAATLLLAALLLSGGDPTPAPAPDPAPLEEAARRGLRLVVKKAERRLELVSPPGEGGVVVRSWPVGLGFAPVGDKERQGDGRTPEGELRVSARIPKSQFYKAFLLSYPELEDADRGERTGLVSRAVAESIRLAHKERRPPPSDTALGGLIEIHGLGAGSDWTLGCVAMDDEAIDELWPVVKVGTRVTVLP